VTAVDARRGQRQRAQLLDVGARQPAVRPLDPDDVDFQQGCG
jgi:hypothetical protein